MSVTTLVLTIRLVFILLYAFCWTGPYNLFQDIAVFIVSLVVLFDGIAGV